MLDRACLSRCPSLSTVLLYVAPCTSGFPHFQITVFSQIRPNLDKMMRQAQKYRSIAERPNRIPNPHAK